MRIFVLQRGWVVVGVERDEGDQIVIERGHVVRRWGTTDGLGELASKGPLSKTKLDEFAHPVRFHRLSVICTFDCDGAAWNKH